MPKHRSVMTAATENDLLLFKAIALSDEAAFGRLFGQYRARVYTIALRLTKSRFAAEEITQGVFISIWTSRDCLHAVKDPPAYIYTIVYNKVSRHLKKEKNKERILGMALWNGKGATNETEETVYLNEGRRFVNKALARLSPQKKLIYDLSRNEGKSYEEIAKTLNLSTHTVKSHLLTAMKFIRNYLKDNALSIGGILAGFLL